MKRNQGNGVVDELTPQHRPIDGQRTLPIIGYPDSLPLASIVIGDRIRKHAGNIEGLAESIRGVGLLHPVVVTPDFRLVAGYRRIMAMRHLGWVESPARVVDSLDDALSLIRAELEENTERLDLTPEEAVHTAKRIEGVVKQGAKERQATSTGGVKPTIKPASGKLPEAAPTKGDSRDILGATVGLSGKTFEKAAAVVEAAEREPEFRPLVEEMNLTGKVDGAFKKLQAAQAPPKNPEVERINRAGEGWLKIFEEYCIIIRSIQKEGGIKDLAKNWPRERIEGSIESIGSMCGEFMALREQLMEMLG